MTDVKHTMSPKSGEGICVKKIAEAELKITNALGQANLETVIKSAQMGREVDLEDALEEIGVGRYTYTVLFISCFSLVTASTEAFGIGLILTSGQCDLDLDTSRKGIIAALPMIGILLSMHGWGYLADTRGRRYVMLITLGGSWIMGFASSFVTHWIALATIKLLSVIFASGANAVIYALLAEVVPKSSRNRFMMLSNTSLQLSQAALGLIGYLTLRHDFQIPLHLIGVTYRPWRMMCQVFALLNLIANVFYFALVFESPKFILSKGQTEEALAVLSKIYALNSGKKPDSYPIISITMAEDTKRSEEGNLLASMWNQTTPLFHRKYLKDTCLIMYIAIVAFSVAPALVIWLPQVVNAFIRASSSGVGTVDTFCDKVVYQLGNASNASKMLGVCDGRVDDLVLYSMISLSIYITILSLISTLMIGLLGKKTVVIILNVVGAAAAWALNNVHGFASLGLFLTICSNATVMGIVSAFAVEIYPTYFRTMAVCLTMMAGRGFSFIIINIMGPQVETNCTNFFYGYGVFIISAAVVGFFLPRDKKRDSPAKFQDREAK